MFCVVYCGLTANIDMIQHTYIHRWSLNITWTLYVWENGAHVECVMFSTNFVRGFFLRMMQSGSMSFHRVLITSKVLKIIYAHLYNVTLSCLQIFMWRVRFTCGMVLKSYRTHKSIPPRTVADTTFQYTYLNYPRRFQCYCCLTTYYLKWRKDISGGTYG